MQDAGPNDTDDGANDRQDGTEKQRGYGDEREDTEEAYDLDADTDTTPVDGTPKRRDAPDDATYGGKDDITPTGVDQPRPTKVGTDRTKQADIDADSTTDRDDADEDAES